LRADESLLSILQGTLYSQGFGNKINEADGLHWYKMAALKSDHQDDTISQIAQYAVGISLITGTTKNVFEPIGLRGQRIVSFSSW
jgi:hypothetical protein